MSNLVNIKIHGILGKQLGKTEWKLYAKNVGEAIRGVQCNSKKLYKLLYDNDKKNIRYRVLINDQDFAMDEEKDPDTIEGLMASELVMDLDRLKTIDIVPVIEGSDNILAVFTIILGVMLIAAGGAGLGILGAKGALGAASASMSTIGFTAGMQVMAGIGLLAAGVTSLMTPMPKFGDFREIEDGGSASYLFAGPENTIQEGGPVFVAYGRLLVGSHVIQSAADHMNVDAEFGSVSAKWGDKKGYGLRYNIPSGPTLLDTAAQKWGKDD